MDKRAGKTTSNGNDIVFLLLLVDVAEDLGYRITYFNIE